VADPIQTHSHPICLSCSHTLQLVLVSDTASMADNTLYKYDLRLKFVLAVWHLLDRNWT